MLDCFQSKTNVTACYVGFNIVAEGRSVVFSGNQLLYFVDSKMAGQWVIMVPTNQLGSDNFWHIR